MSDCINLQALFDGDPIQEGRYFFARTAATQRSTQESWGLVMVVTPDLLPNTSHHEKRDAIRNHLAHFDKVHPCWLMGRHQKHLYYPHESQLDKFHNHNLRDIFKKYYDLSTGDAASNGIDYFTTDILNDRENINYAHPELGLIHMDSPSLRRRNASGLFFSEDRSRGLSDLFESDEEDGRRKRRRSRYHQQDSTSPIRDALLTPSISDQTILQQDQIKTEEEEQVLKDISQATGPLVTIYVGSNSQEHKIPQTDLAKSPVLNSWLKADSDVPYIMHPNLRSINNRHFTSLMRFMHKGEYTPKIVDIPVGMNSGRTAVLTRKGLDKLTTPEEYSAQLVRAGRLYLLAEQFQVEGFTKYIYDRIESAEFATYNNEDVLKLAEIIFTRSNAKVPTDDGEVIELEAWIINKLAGEFQAVMKKHATQFFKVSEKTRTSHFLQRLLRRKAEQVDDAGGEPYQID